jgi:hypothetical protein
LGVGEGTLTSTAEKINVYSTFVGGPEGRKPLGRSRRKKNSMASVRERTIPTERPPPVSEGSSANF